MAPMATSDDTILRLIRVTKTFPGVVALSQVSFDLRQGEVHALVGENGAGKSTLINIISGVLQPDEGQIIYRGSTIEVQNPVEARKIGIVTVFQEAQMFATLSVAENMALSNGLPVHPWGLINWGNVYDQARQAVRRIGKPIEVHRTGSSLTVGQRHMTQVSVAVLQNASILVLDEPTSALADTDADWLFQQVNRLKSRGAAVIYISHRQDEILQLADRITVLRDGRHVWTGPKSQTNRQQLIEAMVGRTSGHDVQGRPALREDKIDGRPRLQVTGLTDTMSAFTDIDLTAHAGEIVGIYGLVGSGRSQLAHALFGLRHTSRGEVKVDGKTVELTNAGAAVRAGLAYLPEDRLRQGILGQLSIRSNVVISSLWRWVHGGFNFVAPERRAAGDMIRKLDVRARSVEQPIDQLSGGNQQKAVLGRWLLTNPKVLILDEPTRGVDVGAKAEIHRIINALADDGTAVIMISSELPEVMQYSDRVVVFRQGRLAGEFDPLQSTSSDVATRAFPHESSAASTAGNSKAISPDTRLRPAKWRRFLSSELGLLAITVSLAATLAVSSEGFRIFDVLANASKWSILGMAAACVIIVGGIDISIGALLALSAICAAMVLKSPLPPTASMPLAILTATAVGTLGGLLNGAISLIGRVHPIVVTLGTMTIYRGLVIALLGGKALTGLPPQFGRLTIVPESGVRGSLLAAGFLMVLCHIGLNHTRTGRYMYALGSGRSAALLFGIPSNRVWLTAFGVAGALTGIAGAMQLSESMQVQSQLGKGWELSAIAVAVIGGVAITGGRGTVFGVILGAIMLRLVNSALVRWGVSDDQVDLVVGALILAAVLFDLFWRRRTTIPD